MKTMHWKIHNAESKELRIKKYIILQYVGWPFNDFKIVTDIYTKEIHVWKYMKY